MNFKKVVLTVLTTLAFINPPAAVKADIYQDNDIPDEIKTRIEEIVDLPSRLAGIDGFKQKSRIERIQDNIDWYKKHGRVNNFYMRYCLDIENFRNQDDYMTVGELQRYNIHHENINPRKYVRRICDKFWFANIVRNWYPEYLPKIYIRFRGKEILTKRYKNLNTINYIMKLEDGKYFAKPIDSTCGNDAIRITKNGKKLMFEHVTEGKITQNKFIQITNSRTFMLQEYVENHKDIKKLAPDALNTVRIVTTRFHDDVHVLSADLRVCCNKDSVVDNFHKEGAIIHVDTDTGQLGKYAFRMEKSVLKSHPITKMVFEGYQLPFWEESIEMVKNLHEVFFRVPSIGWDVAITPTGPKIIEGNCGWDIAVPQTTTGGIKQLWEQLKNI